MRAMIPFTVCALLGLSVAASLSGCEKSSPAPAPGKSPANATKEHDHDHDHDHDQGAMAKGDHGPMIDLGSVVIGTHTVKASRDEGVLTPGGEGAFDVVIEGDLSTILAVRIWVGTRDAKGSVKAKAEPEHGDHPEHRHAHVEIPSPLPDGSQFWVELEVDGGEKRVGGFKLTG